MATPITEQLRQGCLRGSDDLNSLLQRTPITIATREKITSSLWGHHIGQSTCPIEAKDLDPYFEYYAGQSGFYDTGRETWAKIHQDIIDVSALLQKDLNRDE
jgi:hypothetical protein